MKDNPSRGKFLDSLAGVFALIVAVIGLNVIVFLVAYNNWLSGAFILIGLIVLNGLIIVAPAKIVPGFIPGGALKTCALSLGSFWAAILFLELVFPWVTPKDYAQIMDLRNRFLLSPEIDWRGTGFISKGESVNMAPDGHIDSKKRASVSWHVPGHVYVYEGFEPNLGKTYQNLVLWNSMGYFDKDYSLTKSEKTHRIVVIGDSYVESVQVPLNRTFHKILEQTLNEREFRGASESVEVIALGSSGAGQRQNFRTLSEQASLFSPDIVVMTLCSNDFCDDDPALKRELDLIAGVISPITRNLIAHGYFALAFAVRRIEDIGRRRVFVSPELLQWTKNPPSRISDAFQNTLNSIRASKEYCENRGITFLLVYLGSEIEIKYATDPVHTIEGLRSMGPGYVELEWDFENPLSILKSFCKSNGIILLSLRDALADAQKRSGLLVFGDHYSMFGHQVVSGCLDCAIEILVGGKSADRMQDIEKLCKKSFTYSR
jgi:hypothetical protein